VGAAPQELKFYNSGGNNGKIDFVSNSNNRGSGGGGWDDQLI